VASVVESCEARSEEAAVPATVHCEAATAPLTGLAKVTSTSVGPAVRAVNAGGAGGAAYVTSTVPTEW